MEAVVAQALCRKLLHVRRRNSTAENAELSEANVVEQDQDDVGRALGWTRDLRKGGRIGVLVRATDLALEVKIRARQREQATWGS